MRINQYSGVRRSYNTTNIIVNHIMNNLREYFITITIILIGILLGIVYINNIPDISFESISQYINSIIDTIKNNNISSSIVTLKTSIINNLSLGLLIWIFGSTIIGIVIVYFIIAFKGFSFGYTISSIISTLGVRKGLIFIGSGMFLQNIIAIPCFIVLGVSSTKLCYTIIRNKSEVNIKSELLQHTIFSFFIFILLIFSSIVEVYISQKLLIYFTKFI